VDQWLYYRLTGVTNPRLLVKKLRKAHCYAAVYAHGWEGGLCLYVATQDFPYEALAGHAMRTYTLDACGMRDLPWSLRRHLLCAEGGMAV
jgi:hypothetical protein